MHEHTNEVLTQGLKFLLNFPTPASNLTIQTELYIIHVCRVRYDSDNVGHNQCGNYIHHYSQCVLANIQPLTHTNCRQDTAQLGVFLCSSTNTHYLTQCCSGGVD